MSSKTLEELLDAAEKGNSQAIKDFYTQVLETELYIPLKPGLYGADENVFTFDKYVVVEHAGKKIIPVFTKKEHIDEWGADSENSGTRVFKSLMRIVTEEIWIYLNPNQEVGKEFSPWELEKLRADGPNAISEILAELEMEVDFELEVNRDSQQFPNLKKKIQSILEAYPEIKEAFLISFKKNEADATTPLFGMRHVDLAPEKLATIVDEITVMDKYTDETEMPIEVVADLDDEKSINRALFKEAYPFYVRD